MERRTNKEKLEKAELYKRKTFLEINSMLSEKYKVSPDVVESIIVDWTAILWCSVKGSKNVIGKY